MKIELMASFEEGKKKFEVRGDNSGWLRFEIDGSQYPQLVKLGLMPMGKLLKVTVEEAK